MFKNTRLTYVLLAMLVAAHRLGGAPQRAAAPRRNPPAGPPTEAPTTTAVPPTATPEPPTATPEPAIGSPEPPIKVLFVPSVDANVIVSGGKIMSDALAKATGLTFEVSVPTSYAATIEEMCASPKDTIGFIPGLGYVLANQLCGVDVAFKAVRFGSDVYYAQITPTPVPPPATSCRWLCSKMPASNPVNRSKPVVTRSR